MSCSGTKRSNDGEARTCNSSVSAAVPRGATGLSAVCDCGIS